MLAALSTVAAALLAVLVLNAGGEVLDVRRNQVVPRAITARVELRIVDERRTEQMRLRARDRSPNFYKLDVSVLDEIRGRLAGALTLAKAHADDTQKLVEAAAESRMLLDEAGWVELRRLASQEDAGEYERTVDAAIARLKTGPLVEPEPAGTRRTPTEAVLLDPEVPRETRRPMTELLYCNDEAAVAKVVEDAVSTTPETLRKSFNDSILAMLRAPGPQRGLRPLYRFDTSRSVAVAEAARESVPPVVETYAVGDPLADAGAITVDELELLRAEHEAYVSTTQARQQMWFRVAGRTLLGFLVVFGVAAYMRRYQQGVFSNHFRRIVSMAVLLLILGVTRLVFVEIGIPPHFAIGMQVLAAGLLAVVYADEAVFAICGALALLMTMAVQEGIAFFVILLAASGTMVFGLRVVRNRGKIVLVGLGAACIVFLTSVAVGLLHEQQLVFLLTDSLWAAGATLMAAFVIEGVLPGIERLFRLSTGMTLLEWCDASKSLMRMLAAEAPGTYNHSLLVGALAEAAAEAISANGLRCRAGSYYHDVGKINKPEYFVENQRAGLSRHDKLSPAMSLLVIIGHVKDGIEMAKEYGLPASLWAFIPEHHGTTLVQYFYHAANQARGPGDPEVSETEFRYPGPKPQSRETAIVMLCDGVEGAVRAMAEPTPNRIETVVGDIIQKRLADGQFDDCDLTFRELAEIEKSLVKSLCGIYHARIVYPEKEDEKKSAAS
ncbi:MAG: HDIG domain-containing protein [Planctomycetes bacterium]|nr:HDIG domain-containing protein [Planctomycetota bacterium]